MPDIQSTSATNLSTATASTNITATALTAVQVAINNMSQALQDLTHAIQTNATPVAVSNSGNVTLATALGNITVALPQAGEAVQQDLLQQLMSMMQTQKTVTLALQPMPPPTQATLIVPTPTPIVASSTQAVPAAAVPLPQIQMPILPLVPVAKGDLLPALVLPPQTLSVPQVVLPETTQNYAPPLPQILQNTATTPIPSAPPNVVTPQSSASVPATVQIPVTPQNESVETPITTLPTSLPAQVTASVPVAVTNVPPLTVSQPLPTQQTVNAAPAVPSVPLASLLQTGNEVTLQVNAVLPPTVNPATLPPLATNQVVATVTGSMPDGRLIVQAGDATLFVKAQVTAPVGTNLVVTVEAAKTEPLTLLPLPETQNFQSLTQAVAALAQANPQALQQMLATNIPQPNAMLPTTLLVLFGAFKQGDARGFIGKDASDALIEAGKSSLLTSLSRDLSASGQSVQDPVVGEWKSYPIPLYVQQQFQALNLYVHDNKDRSSGNEQGERSEDKKTRFLIDMRLSKLGSIQLDGFVQTKKLDMILRSEAVLPSGLHNELRQSYINAMGAVGYTGTLNFQVGRQHWLNIRQPVPAGIVT